jgi:hypothetical protein
MTNGLEPGDRGTTEPVGGPYGRRQDVREPYFDLTRGGNHFQCVLVDRGGQEWFAELFKNGAFDHRVGGPFDSREAAMEAADREHDAIDSGEFDGW